MVVFSADVQMPMRDWLVGMAVRVPIQAISDNAPETETTEQNEHRATQDLTASLNYQWQRPTENDQRSGAERQQRCVTDGKLHGDAKRASSPRRWRLAGFCERQRRDCHEMVGPQTVEKAKKQCRRN
jgi:hypothetical protein